YLRPASIAVFDAVADLRGRDVEAYATADAGPNVAVLVQPAQAETVAAELTGVAGRAQVRIVGAGPGAHLLTGAPPDDRADAGAGARADNPAGNRANTPASNSARNPADNPADNPAGTQH